MCFFASRNSIVASIIILADPGIEICPRLHTASRRIVFPGIHLGLEVVSS